MRGHALFSSLRGRIAAMIDRHLSASFHVRHEATYAGSHKRRDIRIAARKAEHQARGLSFSRHDGTLSSDELRRIDAYWRAANYLSVGQLYLYDNPLLREPLTRTLRAVSTQVTRYR